MFNFFKPPVSDMANIIVGEFLNGEIVSRDLDGHGISFMSVSVNGVSVDLSWYDSGRPRTISIDGNRSIPKGRDSRAIFEAAYNRAQRVIDEDLKAASDRIGA